MKLISFIFIIFSVAESLKSKDVVLKYPVKALFSQHVQDYVANVTSDTLVCFQNHEFSIPTIFQSASCLFPIFPGLKCESVFGSRTVVVRHQGDMEFLKVSSYPSNLLLSLKDPITVVATRWMEFQTKKDNWVDPNWMVDEFGGRHMTQIHAEPITICARSTNPFGEQAQFHASFRHAYIRERDRRQVLGKLAYHLLLLVAASSIWFLPYLVAFAVAIYAFLHGLKVIMVLLGTGAVVLCLTPFMLTRKNRQLALAYLDYYFNQTQAAEAKQIFRKKKPLFQSLFFSSLLLCSASVAIYMMYHYAIIDREFRNTLLRLNIGISLSWFAFFLCRSFEQLFSDWIWLAMSFMVANFIEKHLNPLAHFTIQVLVTVFSGVISYMIRRLWLTSEFQNGFDQMLMPKVKHLLRSMGWKLKSMKSLNSMATTRSGSFSKDTI